MEIYESSEWKKHELKYRDGDAHQKPQDQIDHERRCSKCSKRMLDKNAEESIQFVINRRGRPQRKRRQKPISTDYEDMARYKRARKPRSNCN
jgi:hypothetical protein